MPIVLVVEDGTGQPTANSYVSLEEANSYLGANLYADAWTNATDDKKAAALVSATRALDHAIQWDGLRIGEGQALEWPRTRVPRSDLYGFNTTVGVRGTFWPDNAVPYLVKHGTCELALAMLQGNRTADDPTRGIDSLKLGQGALEVAFTKDPGQRVFVLPDEVLRIISPIGTPRGRGGTARLQRLQ